MQSIVNDLSQEGLTESELKKLNDFLSLSCGDLLKMQLTETHGLLTAIASAPYIIMPSVWQPMVLGKETDFASVEEVEEMLGLLLRFSNEINRKLRSADLEPLLFVNDKKVALKEANKEGEYDKALGKWCRGYLSGTALDPLWSKEPEARKGLLPFSAFAIDEELGTEMEEIYPSEYKKVQEWTARERDKMSEHVRYFFDYWSKERQKLLPLYNAPPEYALAEKERSRLRIRMDGETYEFSGFNKAHPYERGSPKTGRNDPCNCGSEKKYKKCCGSKEQLLH